MTQPEIEPCTPPLPIDQIVFDAAELMAEYPPRWQHANKAAVFQIANSSGFPYQGEIHYARWKALRLAGPVEKRSHVQVTPGFFEYSPPAPGFTEWHVNFADRHLFGFYSSALMAQDEMQVAEHPTLASLREALLAQHRRAETLDAQGDPTPITVSGVQRRCSIDSKPDPQAGRPEGLYGNAFARAARDQVIAATRALSPPTISNILAMAAPAYGSGRYSLDQIQQVTQNACTGFMAARVESDRVNPTNRRTLIHTGFWGCGAFGGNRILMTMLQALAADLAGVNLHFHAADESGAALVHQTLEQYRCLLESAPSLEQLFDWIDQQAFQWGISDGN